MPSITLNKKVLEKSIGKKLSLDQLKDRISMLGTDLNSIEGNEIHVEIFPNRPDMLSEQGFSRALSSFIGDKTGLINYKVSKSNYKLVVDSSVNKVRPYTVCAVVKGLKFDDEKIKEIINIQEKLHITFCRNRKKAAIGVYPLEKINFPITYKAEDPKKIKFQPLEYPKEITGLQILSQHPTGKEYAHLLEGHSKFPIFEDKNKKVLSMPPIINSHDVGKITESTKDVFIECSGFDLKTLNTCLNIVVTAMADMGGEIFEVEIDYNKNKITTPNLTPIEMDIDIVYVNKILGLDLKEKDLKINLEKMGFGYSKGKVKVPAYRADILHQIDFIEDIAIAYGYENFDEEIPNVATIGEEDSFEIFRKRIVKIMIGYGLLQCHNYNLTSLDDVNKRMNLDLDVVRISNALNEEFNVLRNWLTPGLLKILSENKHYELPHNLFLTGTCFKKDNKEETGIHEFNRLSVVLCDSDADYTKIKQILEGLFQALNIESIYKSTEHLSFIPGRVARVSIQDKDVAYIGEIHPSVLNNWQLEVPVASFELNLTELFNIINKK